MTRESRKIFRFFSTIQEIKRISNKLKDLQWKSDKTSICLDIISRLGYMIYWSFDNLFVLSSLRNSPRKDRFKYIYISNMGWFFGNSISIIKNLFDIIMLMKNSTQQKALAQDISLFGSNLSNIADIENFNFIKINEKKSSKTFHEMHAHPLSIEESKSIRNSEIIKHTKEIIARIADLVISSHSLGIPQRLFNIKLNDLILSICGLTSSCIM